MAFIRAGLDEVGIGALAGPYIAAVAVFREKDLALLPPGVRDSKKTTEEQRQLLYMPICRAAWDVGIGHAWPWEIDNLGPADALQLTYRRALQELKVQYDELVIDGNVGVKSFKQLFAPKKVLVQPKADVNFREVSAASIVAKWFRDAIMISLSKSFPAYRWDSNKGYGTADHEDAIRRHGLIIKDGDLDRYIHRKHYVRKLLTQGVRYAAL